MAGKKRGGSEEGGGAPEWMATYSDLVTLLLCFFILLFSMATIDAQKYVQVANSLRSSFVKISGGDLLLTNKGQEMINVTNQTNPSNTGELSTDTQTYVKKAEEMVADAQQQQENRKMEDAANRIRDIVAEKGLSDKVNVVEEKEFVMVRLDSEVFFQSGRADILPVGQDVLSAITEVLNLLENKDILVQGHTDNVPIQTAQFDSNWELSTARATNVVRYMVDTHQMDPSRLTATGNGEFRPIGDNDTPEGRLANRRIEIRIMR
jgi:chemotaxis protein MotB